MEMCMLQILFSFIFPLTVMQITGTSPFYKGGLKSKRETILFVGPNLKKLKGQPGVSFSTYFGLMVAHTA